MLMTTDATPGLLDALGLQIFRVRRQGSLAPDRYALSDEDAGAGSGSVFDPIHEMEIDRDDELSLYLFDTQAEAEAFSLGVQNFGELPGQNTVIGQGDGIWCALVQMNYPADETSIIPVTEYLSEHHLVRLGIVDEEPERQAMAAC